MPTQRHKVFLRNLPAHVGLAKYLNHSHCEGL